jgi:hypothetical protein
VNIVEIAGHVSRQMLARYNHIRMESKRKALEAIVAKPAPAAKAQNPTEEQAQADATGQTVQKPFNASRPHSSRIQVCTTSAAST